MNDQPLPPAIKPQVSAGGAIAALVPASLDDAFRLAKALSSAGDMVPKHFQGKPEMTMAAIVRGMEIGLAPMQALSNIAVINGRATVWGDALPALMQRAGHHIDVEVTGEGDAMVATATLTRGDTGKVVVRTFSVEDAKKAGLWGKQGPWQSYPRRMLSHRARAWAVRDGAADALMGLEVAEEQQDVPMKDVTPREPGGFAQKAAAARGQVEAQETVDVDPAPSEAAPEPAQEPEDAEVIPAADEAPAKPQDEPERDPAQIRDVLLRALEKVETAEDYQKLTRSNRFNDALLWLLDADKPKGLEVKAKSEAVKKSIEGN